MLKLLLETSKPYLVCVLLERNREGTAKPKVGNLERHVLAIHEQVLWLEVIVKDASSVAKSNAPEDLVRQGHKGKQNSK